MLTVQGTALDDTIIVGRDAGGTLRVNDGAVTVAGGPATVANTSEVHVLGLAGDDDVTFDQSSGALPAGDLRGGGGADALVSGIGADRLLGGPGPDVLDGNQGIDDLVGGDGPDRFTWDPGEGNDEVNGGPGADRVAFRTNALGGQRPARGQWRRR